MQLRCLPLLLAIVVLGAHETPAIAGLITFNSSTPASNSSTRSDWLTAVGIVAPKNIVDFETGFSHLQNISDITGLFADGLVIRDTGPGTPRAIIRMGNGVIGGSNPVGTFSLTHDEQAYLTLDFSAMPVDYVGFQDIDQTGTSVIATFVGGGTSTFSFETTGSSGNSAEFIGIFRNDMARISKIELNASGDGRWGLDTIEYGAAAVPEPSSIVLMGLGIGVVLMVRRKAWVRTAV